jgi:heparan-alpha-glucosaminide N-acetyltransferase
MQVVAEPSRIAPAGALTPVQERNLAIDIYRGFVMFLMMAEVLRLSKVAQSFPGNWFWNVLSFNQSHVAWAGCSLHDTIQPGFSFLVGVALPYSIASRLAKGSTFGRMFTHALWRSLLLVALGIFLRSTHSVHTNFTFEDTLTQIGLGYPFLFLLGSRTARVQWVAFTTILVGYWLAWAVYPVAQPEFAAHWYKNSNLGAAFDVRFLNLFPRPKPFVENGGGYLTLSFIPTLGTMLLGLAAGRWLRESAPSIPIRKMIVAGAIGIAAGAALHYAGVCPIVKRIWTPSWVLFSGGLCFLFLAAFSWILDVKRWRKWAFPLLVIGMNSIAAYLIAHLWERFFFDSLRINLGARLFLIFGDKLQPLLLGATVLGLYWCVLYWMYRHKLFLRI